MDAAVGKERDFIARFAVLGGNLYKFHAPLYFQHRKPNSMSTQKVKVFERELKMLEAWRPRPERDKGRNISVDEFQDYESSVSRSFRRQFARNLESAPTSNVGSPRSLRLVQFLALQVKDRIALIRGRWTYLRYCWCGRDRLWKNRVAVTQC
jgi:hypothetical protein